MNNALLENMCLELECSTAVETLPGREHEIQLLSEYLTRCIGQPGGPGHIFYLYGQPGTGKTATTTYVVHLLEKSNSNLCFCEINCVSLKTSSFLFSALHRKIFSHQKSISNRRSKQELYTYFNKLNEQELKYYIILLDEFENLFNNKDNKLDSNLFELFSWTHLKSSSLSIICIANGIKLYQSRFSARTLSRLGNANVCFASYTWCQMKNALLSRLVEFQAVIDPVALEMLCRKTSFRTGDMRQLFSLTQNLIRKICVKQGRVISIDDVLVEIERLNNNVSLAL